MDDSGRFDWDEGNEEHVLDHGVESAEVQEALLDEGRIGHDARNVLGERRWAVIGATDAGRILLLVYTLRGENIRAVSARVANDAQKRRYRKGS